MDPSTTVKEGRLVIPIKVSSNGKQCFKMDLMGRLDTGGCPKRTLFKMHLWRANHVPGVRQLPGEQDTVPAPAFQHIVMTATRKGPSPYGELRKGFTEEASAKQRQEGKQDSAQERAGT